MIYSYYPGCTLRNKAKDLDTYARACAEKLGFATVNMDNQVGWCEYGKGEEMVAVLTLVMAGSVGG